MKPADEIERLVKQLSFRANPELDASFRDSLVQAGNLRPSTDLAPNERGIGRRIMRIPKARIVLAALVGAGVVTAAAVGVTIQKYRFMEKHPERGYIVQSEDGHSVMNITEDHAASPEQAVETAEEIALLKQQGQRELVGVTEVEVNGQLDGRVLSWKYSLADGRTITVGERDPDDRAPMTLTGERYAEASRLLRQDTSGRSVGHFVTTDQGTYRLSPDGKETPTFDREFQGRTFTFDKHTVTLSDGTEVAWSFGLLREDSPAGARSTAVNPGPLPKDLQEYDALRKQGKGQLMGVRELSARGEVDMRVHVYRYQLSDGRTINMNEDGGGKWFLSSAQRQECVQARKAGSGQDLGTYEEEVMGRTFVFTRQRFVLSDGTELIWSSGNPKDNQ